MSAPSSVHATAPDAKGQADKILFSQFAFAWQAAPPKKDESYLATHSSVPSNGVVDWVDVAVVVRVVVVVGVDVALLVAVVEPVVVADDVTVVV